MPDKELVTCLWFDTEGEAAAKHYTSIFKDSKLGRIVPYGEAGRRDADMTMLVEFELYGQKFIALNGGPQFQHSEAISFQIPCADQDEVDYYWDRLTEGGDEGPCGWLHDKFGVSWQVVPTTGDRAVGRSRSGAGEARERGRLLDDGEDRNRPDRGRRLGRTSPGRLIAQEPIFGGNGSRPAFQGPGL